MTDAGESFNAPDIAVAAGGMTHQGRFLAHEALRECASVNEYFQHAGKTTVVFGDDENELFGSCDQLLDWLEGFAPLPVEVGGDDVWGQVSQRKNLRRVPFFFQYPAINLSDNFGIIWSSVGTGYNGDHQRVLFVKFIALSTIYIYIVCSLYL